MSNVAPPKVHRYLASPVLGGLVEQWYGGIYRLSPGAMATGPAAVRANEPLLRAGEFLPALRDQLAVSCLIAVIGNAGPTVVRAEEADSAILLNVRLGSVLPLLVSATGRAFAAFTTERAFLDRIAQMAPPTPEPPQSLQQIVVEAAARVRDSVMPGVSAVAAPVFNAQGQVAVVMTALGPTGAFDPVFRGSADAAVRQAAGKASKALGWIGASTVAWCSFCRKSAFGVFQPTRSSSPTSLHATNHDRYVSGGSSVIACFPPGVHVESSASRRVDPSDAIEFVLALVRR